MALLAAAMLLLSTGAVTPDEETTVLAASVGVDPGAAGRRQQDGRGACRVSRA